MEIKQDLILSINNVTVRTLTNSMKNDLTELASEPKIWQYAHAPLEAPDYFQENWFKKAIKHMEQKKRWPFCIEYNRNFAGSSSYYNFDPDNKNLYIGYTWYHPQYWGSTLNKTVKYLLLEYAFEKLNLIRVAFAVDELNLRSCKAMKKLGAREEGVLRKHIIRPDGSYRNTIIFAITDDDWNNIKINLLKDIEVSDANN